MTVAALVTAVGVTLLFAAWRRRDPPEVAVLAITSSFALTAIDVIYVTRAVIPPIYLADALVEVVLIVAWTIALIRNRRKLTRNVKVANPRGPVCHPSLEAKVSARFLF
jgi:CHASE2 domain-containing sensor protein